MYGFPVGFSSPESIMADQNDLFPVFSTNFKKLEICQFSPKVNLFHIYWYKIGNVSTIFGVSVGFSSLESILADQNDLFPVFATNFKKLGIYQFFPEINLFHICWY